MNLRPGESQTLARLQFALPLGLVVFGSLGALELDPRALLLFAAAVLLRRMLKNLDPQGISLTLDAEGGWKLSGADFEGAKPCVIQSRGQMTSLVWLQCAVGERASERRSFVVFADSLDPVAYRALRRSLKTSTPSSG